MDSHHRRAGLQPTALLAELPVLGADGESRPHNLLFTRQLLCRLSYTSIKGRDRRLLWRTAGSVELH